MASPFLDAGSHSCASSLAVLHLRRDHLVPVILREAQSDQEVSHYAEGEVVNTRFGSYPHSTLVGLPWGSQVLASKVDTGSRGKKRKANHIALSTGKVDSSNTDGQQGDFKRLKFDEATRKEAGSDDLEPNRVPSPQAIPSAAQSGFCHILPPTPESWTVSLPHRTQVVYTPDYSLIIQRLQVRPGSRIIEAGAGSGSFTHAAARAVFNGCRSLGHASTQAAKESRKGRVFSFEYHEARADALREQITGHGLDETVEIIHRDVYEDGFMLESGPNGAESGIGRSGPSATAVFLDLPAPWQALRHLSRHAKDGTPLSKFHAVHLCCFLPCIEQVQRAITALQSHGWLEIRMEQLQHRRIEVRRERVGLQYEGMRGVNATPASVEESIARLAEVESRNVEFREMQSFRHKLPEEQRGEEARRESKLERRQRIAEEAGPRKPWTEGFLVHKTEPELKSHTSYLVFAILPAEWTEEQELACHKEWPVERTVAVDVKAKAHKFKKNQ